MSETMSAQSALGKRRRKPEPEDLSGRLVARNEPDGIPSEAYRTLRTNLLYSLVDDPPRTILVTSPSPREGKSTTCANLAVALAQAGKKTLLMDCDLRKPVQHRIFGAKNRRGVVDVIAGEMDIEEVWQLSQENLFVLTSGMIPPNPAEILGSERFSALLLQLTETFDYVLLDAPPVQVVSDSAIIASQCDGVLLVIDAQNTGKKAVQRSVANLWSVGATVLGTIMNNVKTSESGYYGYSYSYTD